MVGLAAPGGRSDSSQSCGLGQAWRQLIVVAGRAAIQAALELSAQEAAGGAPHPGRLRSAEPLRHVRQPGWVTLSDQKPAVERPRLRKRAGGEEGGAGIAV